MVLISVFEISPGWVELRSRFDRAVVDAFKTIPGLRWVKERKSWAAPQHALPVLIRVLGEYAKFVPMTALHGGQAPLLHPGLAKGLRPYQEDGALRLINNRGHVLSFDMRLGKTRTAAVAAGSLMAQGLVNTIGVLYPNAARGEWTRQFKEQTGLDVISFESTKRFPPAEFARILALPHLCIGMHYELDPHPGNPDGRAAEFRELMERRGKFAVIADEVHYLKNRKAGRTKFVLELSRSPNCGWRWGLTGTPMRNYPRDMWAMFDFIQPDAMGSYSKFTSRYANGRMGEYGWLDDGVTNNEELAERLKLCSYRLTRAEVAGWLPKSDRSVVLCNMGVAEQKTYKKREAALGTSALKAMNEGDSANAVNALKQLVSLTTATKMSTLLDRIYEHAENRKVKVLVFANFHETLQTAWDAFQSATEGKAPRFGVPAFLVGGWIPSEKRRREIDVWREIDGPAVLFANMLSSGVGIDLSDADAALFVELTWVPADFLQAEARIQDVHLGKRTTPPIYEYLLVRGTVDEDMGMKLINKVAAIEKVVGGDAEIKGVDAALRDSGLVDRNALSLASEDAETVGAVLDELRARLFGDETPDLVGDDSDNADAVEEPDEPETEEDP